MLGSPELDAELQVGSHESGVKGQNALPRPAGHASLDAAQDTVGFLGCKRTLPACVPLVHLAALAGVGPGVSRRESREAFMNLPIFLCYALLVAHRNWARSCGISSATSARYPCQMAVNPKTI